MLYDTCYATSHALLKPGCCCRHSERVLATGKYKIIAITSSYIGNFPRNIQCPWPMLFCVLFWFGISEFNQRYFRITSSDNRMIALVPANESTNNYDITQTKRSTTNLLAYFMPYTIHICTRTIRIVVHGRYLTFPTFPRAIPSNKGNTNLYWYWLNIRCVYANINVRVCIKRN